MAIRLPALCHLDWQERHGAITATRPLEKRKRLLAEDVPAQCRRLSDVVQCAVHWIETRMQSEGGGDGL